MHKLIRFFSVLSFAIVFGAVAANAQTLTKVEADIPFAFSVGNVELAPGKYDLQVTGSAAGNAVVRIAQKGGTGNWTVLGLANGEFANGRAELVFDRYGDERVLRQISLSDNAIGIAAKGRRKVRLAKDIRSNPETVTLALN